MTKSAAINLGSIETYIGSDNPLAAIHVLERIAEATEYLITFPTIGRPGRVSKTRELIISGTPFIVMYQIRGTIIVVLRILHAAIKWPTYTPN